MLKINDDQKTNLEDMLRMLKDFRSSKAMEDVRKYLDSEDPRDLDNAVQSILGSITLDDTEDVHNFLIALNALYNALETIESNASKYKIK